MGLEGLEALKGRNTLVVLSAREVLPNIIVGLYLKKKGIINRVIILTTDWREAILMAGRQEKIFKRGGLSTDILLIPTYDHREIQKILNEAIGKGKLRPSNSILLTNSSTKYTVEVVHHYLNTLGGLSIYYLPDRVVKIFGGEELFKINESVLNIVDFLNLAGFELETLNTFENLGNNSIELLSFFYKALIDNETFCFPEERIKRENIQKEKNLLKNLGLKNFYRRPDRNLYTDGLALELIVYKTLRDSSVFKEVVANVKISTLKGTQTIKNEIDVLALKNDILFYFSCKRGRNVNWNEHIHRVAHLARRIGGRYAVPVIVSCEDNPVQKNRAKIWGVNWITPKEFINFPKTPENFLKEWQKTSTGFTLV